MGIQPHQPAWVRQSEWRDGANYDRLQHETRHEYPGNTATAGITQNLEARLCEGRLALPKTRHFKPLQPLQFLLLQMGCLN